MTPSSTDSVKHTAGPKPLTQREQRMLDRLQIKWAKKTITEEEKGYANALSDRAWRAAKAKEAIVEHTPGPDENLLIGVAALLGPFVEDGTPISRGEARDMLVRVRKARAAIAKAQGGAV